MEALAAAGRKRRGFMETYGGIKKNTEPSGGLRRTIVHHDAELLWGESARIVRGENRLGKLNASTIQAKQPFR